MFPALTANMGSAYVGAAVNTNEGEYIQELYQFSRYVMTG